MRLDLLALTFLLITLSVALTVVVIRFLLFKRRIREAVGVESDDPNLIAKLIAEKVKKQDVREKTRLLSQALNLLHEGLLIMDPYGRIVYTNRFARSLLDIGDNYIGKYYYQVISDLDVISFINSSFDSKYRIWDNQRIKDRFVQIVFASNMDEKVLLIHDLTQIKRYENLKKDFIANVSHEFKTPVATLKLLMETLEDECRGNKTAEEFIRKASDRVNYMEQLIQDLITLSMLETSKGVTVKPSEFSLRELLDQVKEDVDLLARQKRVKIELKVSGDVKVKSDRKIIQIVLKNLIDNAIKYNFEGGKVTIGYSRLPKDHVISICDTGPGIPKSHLPFIFERFYRVDKSRSRKLGGTGLGLSIVKLAVEKVDGRVIVESEVGKGSCFKVFIPV